jgi:hypothetical protein
LKISPDYLLRDDLEQNDISDIQLLNRLWKEAPPSKQALCVAMLKAALEDEGE